MPIKNSEKSYIINHNHLLDFCRLFFPYISVVIEPRKRESTLKEKKNIVELYINKGLSVKQIAKKYNRSYDAIKDTLLKNNVCIGNKKVNRRIIE